MTSQPFKSILRRISLFGGLALLLSLLSLSSVSPTVQSAAVHLPTLQLDSTQNLEQSLINGSLSPLINAGRAADTLVQGLLVNLRGSRQTTYHLFGSYYANGQYRRGGYSSDFQATPKRSNHLDQRISCLPSSTSGQLPPPCSVFNDFFQASLQGSTAYNLFTPDPNYYANAHYVPAQEGSFIPANMEQDIKTVSQQGPVLFVAATPPDFQSQVAARPLIIAPHYAPITQGWDWIAPYGRRGSPFDFSGSWNTDYGTVKLHQFNNYVIGDYANQGVMLGKVDGACVAGVFTNGADNGIFRFSGAPDDPQDRLYGFWAWHGAPLQREWDGTRQSDQATQFYNFTRNGSMTQRLDNDRTHIDGTFSSDFGEVRLVSRDLFLVGDYADRGIIAGMWDGDSFVGRFTNGDRTGWFDFAFFSRNGTFRDGTWGWIDDNNRESWTLNRTSRQTPTISNMVDDVSCL